MNLAKTKKTNKKRQYAHKIYNNLFLNLSLKGKRCEYEQEKYRKLFEEEKHKKQQYACKR